MTLELRALLWKEVRQLTRSRRAMASSILLPLLIMVIIPMGQITSSAAAGQAGLVTRPVPPGAPLPPGLDPTSPVALLTHLLLPLFMTIGGIVVPSVAATYTVATERERRSLELLMALPVRVRDILAAKVVAMLLMAGVVVLPLFAVDAVALLVTGIGSLSYVLLLLLILLSGLACSVGIALLLALLARDFRTANNLNGALVGPLILLSTAILFLVPGDGGLLLLAGALLLFGAATFAASVRWLTFERYLA